MWLFTRYGFFSVVCARKGQGESGQGIDPDLMMVRARSLGHLKALTKRFPEQLGDCEIRVSESTDYRFRIFVEKAVWSRVVSGLAEEIDYSNFKNEAAQYERRAGVAYEDSLHDVWGVMRRLQQ